MLVIWKHSDSGAVLCQVTNLHLALSLSATWEWLILCKPPVA